MKKILTILCIGLLVFACQEEGADEPHQAEIDAPMVLDQYQSAIKVTDIDDGESSKVAKNDDDKLQIWMAQFNASIANQGIQLVKMEFLGLDQVGRTVFFDNKGSKQLSFDWVPNDPRNNDFGATVPYYIDVAELGTSSGLSDFETFEAINNTMATWDELACSKGLEIPFLGLSGDTGLVQFFEGYGGSNLIIRGAVAHAGILPAEFFEAIGGPGGGNGILGVTFTFSYTNSDIDGNGKGDTALAEIYINDNFNWQDAPNDMLFDPEGVIDFETVVLHEVGHSLGQAHFGTAFRDGGRGRLHFAPYALMNAGYTKANRDVTGTDEAGHCSNWGVWPNE